MNGEALNPYFSVNEVQILMLKVLWGGNIARPMYFTNIKYAVLIFN